MDLIPLHPPGDIACADVAWYPGAVLTAGELFCQGYANQPPDLVGMEMFPERYFDDAISVGTGLGTSEWTYVNEQPAAAEHAAVALAVMITFGLGVVLGALVRGRR
jgi:hypothetical protein